MANKQIVGIKETRSKAGNLGYNYYYTEPFSDYEAETAVSLVGLSCGVEYSRKRFDVVPGDEVNMIYEKGFQDRAQLADMQVVKSIRKG